MSVISDIPAASEGLLAAVGRLADAYLATRPSSVVVPPHDDASLSRRIDDLLQAAPRPAAEVAAELFELLADGVVRTDSPRYFGLFNPPALPEGAAGDLIAAAVNPQLAVWSHAPAAAAIEARLVRLFGELAGWPSDQRAGTFTTGGTEANHTAVLAALARRYPDWGRRGVAGLRKPPALFVSSEAHLAWIKIARAAGLGSEAVRLVTPADGLRLTGEGMRQAIAAAPEVDPLLIVGTAGATSHGAVDDLAGLADAARAQQAWFHVDAAWAGATLLLPEHRNLLAGVELADSLTIDPHKALCAPMGTGLYLARDWAPLAAAFEVSTGYMPPRSDEQRDPYLHSLQWSRRFIGLRVFTILAMGGLDAAAARLRHQFAMGDRLRSGLAADGWRIVNATALPLVCVRPEPSDAAAVQRVVASVARSGRAWVSEARVAGSPAVRACVTSYETMPEDVDELIALLAKGRAG